MEQEYSAGRVKLLGACDLSVADLETLESYTKISPHALQVDMGAHCCAVPPEVKSYSAAKSIRLLSHEDNSEGAWHLRRAREGISWKERNVPCVGDCRVFGECHDLVFVVL